MTNISYDSIVIGSGPGGATVAKEMAEKGHRVLILEWGSNTDIKGNLSQFIINAGFPGKSLLFTDKTLLAMVRGICTGGSSVYYCATAFDPPHDMLKSYGIDIRKEVAQVKSEVPVAPLKDELMGPAAGLIMESAKSLGYDWSKLNKFIFQDKCRLGCKKCSYGCPYGAKWTARNFVETAVDNGAVLMNGAKVERILIENGKAVGVEYRSGGHRHRAFGDKIIVSAGGIGTPGILRQSGIYESGYDFFFDPLIMVFGTVPGLRSDGEPQMAAGVHMEAEGYLMTDLNFPAPVLAGQSALKFRSHQAFYRDSRLMLMVKAKDSLGGRITWKGGVRKSLDREDNAKLLKGYDRAREIFERAGAKNIFSGMKLAAHPGGTARIGEIVDSDLKTPYDNLYVCDCSVIPEAWGLPPTLTLLGLGKRLAAHLQSFR